MTLRWKPVDSDSSLLRAICQYSSREADAGNPIPIAEPGVGDIDFIVVRENNEGEYSSVGGRMFDGTDFEFATQQSVFTRRGVDRILRYSFETAFRRHSFGPWSLVHWNDRHRSVGEFESGTRFPFDVRAGARIGAGYCRQRSGKSDRSNLGRGNDA